MTLQLIIYFLIYKIECSFLDIMMIIEFVVHEQINGKIKFIFLTMIFNYIIIILKLISFVEHN